MKTIHCVTQEGEAFTILKTEDGMYCCPVCGSPEFKEAPYNEDGTASFEICSCGFEFGYDDSPLASGEAVEGIENNWDRWRLKVIEKNSHTKSDLENLENNLKNLGIELAFDLIPVKRNENT
ncbi:MAG: hypothetical protein OEZ58_03330 [Gammaproteobacteria bacterium]|nr:hypothetical protein [Gammaproteobacteria bacterium]MDH5727995.1 hypothetical protein [Gammaproteobacteria bacterium]